MASRLDEIRERWSQRLVELCVYLLTHHRFPSMYVPEQYRDTVRHAPADIAALLRVVEIAERLACEIDPIWTQELRAALAPLLEDGDGTP